MISEKQVIDPMPAAEPARHASVAEIRSGIEHTRGGSVDATESSTAEAKPPLAVVASVAGVTVVSLIWWRRRRRR